MFSALFAVTFAEGVDDAAKDQFVAEARQAAEAVSSVYLADKVLEPPMPGGDFVCEVGFADQAAYEQAKGQASWEALDALMHDGGKVANCEFIAYGEGTLTLQETEESACHRVLFFSLRDGADPAMVEKMESVMNDMTAHVPGLRNCKFAPVVESSGTDEWAYAYECDFDDPMTFLGKYMSTPFHFLYIDKFFEPACGEWVVNTNLCTPYLAQETPFLANFA
ncbi:Dabb family protein [uncultured Adlercreutzia sp.]|uniref:Dabb family protein n=1 Tax=uncultured Adlercreutzia sp. TaxID=875803 RepID=UPI002674D550|nr:Dabb family protein [uncultured Adlercreutzia sp.]